MTYELSDKAERDLADVFDYTFKQFGYNQAVNYLSSFKSAFNKLVENPKIGRQRTEIRKGLRSIIKESHVVFYAIKIDKILVVRVLHGSRDLPKFLRQPI